MFFDVLGSVINNIYVYMHETNFNFGEVSFSFWDVFIAVTVMSIAVYSFYKIIEYGDDD